jgi:hypothetical protein
MLNMARMIAEWQGDSCIHKEGVNALRNMDRQPERFEAQDAVFHDALPPHVAFGSESRRGVRVRFFLR